MINFEGRGDWYPGRIAAINKDGTYKVIFDDGVFSVLNAHFSLPLMQQYSNWLITRLPY